MFVEAIEHVGGRRAVIKAGRVVIFSDVGTPIVVAVQMDNGTYRAATIVDPDFGKMLDELGMGHLKSHVHRLSSSLPLQTPPNG